MTTSVPTLTPEAQTVAEAVETPRARVILINDDFTPMDFVVEILHDYFGMGEIQAEAVMMAIHTQGSGVCGTFEEPEAQKRADGVIRIARVMGHPLQCIVERAAKGE